MAAVKISVLEAVRIEPDKPAGGVRFAFVAAGVVVIDRTITRAQAEQLRAAVDEALRAVR